MDFKPCIDIHNGKVKQIVGSTLSDESGAASENFISDRNGAYYASLYRSYGLEGGHVINLNRADSPFYDASRQQMFDALFAYPGGLMAGGGINADNAAEYIDAGASHVIVTSFVFRDGKIDRENLARLNGAVGPEHIVLDMSCIYKDGAYMVATDRWQKISDEKVCPELFESLAGCCDGFLVHAVDAEGRSSGIDERLIGILASSPISICYAGGISSLDDIRKLREAGGGRVDFTIGSGLKIFGGSLGIEEIIECIR
ncbi:MAG: phosphoribosylformimino-5-aminoimidazole carboxamide ribotide isomerase [Lachnospiraceae bacterium]|nr:phosphoribosylformimino-5-aminoimidazole carboxamide ribotide isomerase [Lachnospiraceae bacterium]